MAWVAWAVDREVRLSRLSFDMVDTHCDCDRAAGFDMASMMQGMGGGAGGAGGT